MRSRPAPARQALFPGAALEQPDHARFPALNGLRALAVGAVVLTHAAFGTGRYVRGPGSALLAHLDIGVALFFVISGFLLSREWFQARACGRAPVPVRAYLWRRALRILPLYWLTVVLAMITLRGNAGSSALDWLRQFSLLEIYRYGWLKYGLTQCWSLCTEAAFYLLLPALAGAAVLLSRWLSLAWAATVTAAALTGVTIAWLVWVHRASSPDLAGAGFWLPTYLDWFAIGIAMAGIQVQLSYQPLRAREPWGWARTLGAHPGVCWTVAAASYLLVVTPLTGSLTLAPSGTSEAILRNLLYTVFSAALAWPAVFAEAPLTRAVLANRPMSYLGDISYGVFLLHMTLLSAATNLLRYPLFTGSTLILFTLTLALTLPLAAVAYRWVERPARRLRHLVPARRAVAPSRRAA